MSLTTGLSTGIENLGLDPGTVAEVTADWPAGDCTAARGRLATAVAAAGDAYHFPGDAGLSCDLAADGGDVHDRIGVWEQVLSRVARRDPLPDTPGGVALAFPFDVELAGTLGRLAVAEYRCCSFGSCTLVIDGTGLRLEIRMPAEAAGTLAAVVGSPEVRGARPAQR
jgi:hypothetical protein